MHTTVLSLHLSAAWDGSAGKTRGLCRGLVSFLGCCGCRVLCMGALGGCMGDRVHTELSLAVGGPVNIQIFLLLRGWRC